VYRRRWQEKESGRTEVVVQLWEWGVMVLAWESAPHSVWAPVGTGVISVYPFSEVDGLMPGTTACMDLSLSLDQPWE